MQEGDPRLVKSSLNPIADSSIKLQAAMLDQLGYVTHQIQMWVSSESPEQIPLLYRYGIEWVVKL